MLAEHSKAIDAGMGEIEDKFWEEEISKPRIYSINNPMSLFDDSVKIWNLNQLTKDESWIHSKPAHRFLKVSYCLTRQYYKTRQFHVKLRSLSVEYITPDLHLIHSVN